MSIKVLVVDDEETIRQGVVNFLKMKAELIDAVYEAKNGIEAVDMVVKYQPDIVLLDVHMPTKNGIEVMKEIQVLPYKPLVLILSGHDEFKYAQEAIRYGAKNYILKPVGANEILANINELIEKYLQDKVTIQKNESTEQELPNATIHIAVKSAKRYIDEHYFEDVTLSSIADTLDISSSYLSTLFNKELQCSFVDYLNQIRIEKACAYLNYPQYKTYDIAYKVGFRDEKYFSKVFKKVMGVSPREYRKR
ncbi:MAG: response regulator [Bacillota bacterium]